MSCEAEAWSDGETTHRYIICLPGSDHLNFYHLGLLPCKSV